MGREKFAGTGIVVGKTPQTRQTQKTKTLKGNKVTM